MRIHSIVFTSLAMLMNTILSCGDETSSQMIGADVVGVDTVSAVDASPDAGDTSESLCREGTDTAFVPSEPYAPQGFSSPNGYQRRLAVQGGSACAVGASGTVFCWGNESISGVEPTLRDSWNRALVVDVVKMPLEDIVDISLLGFLSQNAFALAVDSRGQVWGWSFHEDLSPFRKVCKSEKWCILPSRS